MVLPTPIMSNIFIGIIIFLGVLIMCQNIGNCGNPDQQRLEHVPAENTPIADNSLNNCFVIEEDLEIGIGKKDDNIDDNEDDNEHNLPSYGEVFK